MRRYQSLKVHFLNYHAMHPSLAFWVSKNACASVEGVRALLSRSKFIQFGNYRTTLTPGVHYPLGHPPACSEYLVPGLGARLGGGRAKRAHNRSVKVAGSGHDTRSTACRGTAHPRRVWAACRAGPAACIGPSQQLLHTRPRARACGG